MNIDASDQVSHTRKNHMGVVRSILAAVTIYFVPQLFAGFFVALWAQSAGSDFDAFYDDNTIVINFLFSVSSLCIGLLLTYLLTKGLGGMKAIGYKFIPGRKMLLVIPVYIIYFAVLIAVFTLIDYLNIGVDLDQDQVVGFESAAKTMQIIFAFISLVIVAPVVEETLFRGVLFTNIARKTGFLPAAVLISGLFALAHMQLNVGIDTFLLGMGASWLVWRTGSIYPAILLHMLKNSVAFVILFIFN